MLNLSRNRIHELVPRDRLYSLRALTSPRASRVLAHWILGIALLTLLVMFLPWQQNIHGTGLVTALSPAHRPQVVPTLIAGRISEWRVMEGQYVHTGDTLVVIGEIKEKYFDPELLTRTREQLKAKEGMLASKRDKASALQRQLEALRTANRTKLEQVNAKLQAEEVKFKNAENQFERNKLLFEAGNITLTKFQDTEYKYKLSQADLRNARIELEQVQAEYNDKISKSESEYNNTLADAFESEAEIAKLSNELANLTIRNDQYVIRAPQTGHVVRALKAGVGETISEGESVCTIMPEVSDLAVEMYVRAMDVPLISEGRKVRIQFDGWPALQFSGWPSISVGTFGGTVRVIDYVSSQSGMFRVLVIPDQADEKWPPQLRVGSGTKGWVMLNNVPVWFEIWRQLNGFPASLYQAPEPPPSKSKPVKKDGSKDK